MINVTYLSGITLAIAV